MAISKLFNPKVGALAGEMFVSPPISPEVGPSFEATSGGEACNPLTFSGADQGKSLKLSPKRIVSKAREPFDY